MTDEERNKRIEFLEESIYLRQIKAEKKQNKRDLIAFLLLSALHYFFLFKISGADTVSTFLLFIPLSLVFGGITFLLIMQYNHFFVYPNIENWIDIYEMRREIEVLKNLKL